MLKYLLPFFQVMLVLPVFAVGGYSQAAIVYNNTDSSLSLQCCGGARKVRENTITVAPHTSQYFLGDVIEDHDMLLGGNYQCSMSIGPFNDHKFSMTLENGQEIAVWTLGPDYQASRSFSCGAEPFYNFYRSGEIIQSINAGQGYNGAWQCTPKSF